MLHSRLSSLALAIALGFGLLAAALGLIAHTAPALARESSPVVPVASQPGLVGAASLLTSVNTFTDDNTPNGNCTLREAVIAANTNKPVDACPAGNPGLDTIALAQGVYFLTIPGINEDAAATGDLDITESLLIKGAAAFSTSVDGPAHGDRIFHVLTGSLTLQDMAVISGVAVGSGGGILHQSADPLHLERVHVVDNTADSGGGLAVTSGAVVLTDTFVAFNYANGGGGGIFQTEGSVALEKSLIFSNTAVYSGGGVALTGGEVRLASSHISGNTAVEGGGMYLAGGIGLLTGGQIVSNTASSNGGGVFNGGRFLMQDGAILSNTAFSGAGVSVSFGGQFTQTNGSIGANHATVSGGGLASIDADSVQLSGGKIISNSAGVNGGGLYIFNNGSFAGVTLSGVEIISNVAQTGSGGGLHVDISAGGGVRLTAGRISGNRAETNGGGVYSNELFTQTGGQISDNEAKIGDGGGLYLGGFFTNVISGGQVLRNSAPGGLQLGGSGGGIFLSSGTLLLSNADISYNSAGEGAGIGVFGEGATLSQTGVVTISHNLASRTGGGIGVGSANQANLTGAKILYNTATVDGGGFLQSGGSLEINNSCVVGNSDTAGSFVNGILPVNATNATGNWWGAADGPGGVGPGSGDSVSVNVDYSGFLTAPLTGCPFVGPQRLLLVESDGATRVAEGGVSDDYTLRLTRPPVLPTPVAITADGQTTVLPNVITFTAANWFVPQKVLVVAVDDTIPEYFHTGTITSSATVIRLPNVMSLTITAHITDNDVAVDLEAAKSAPAAGVQGTKFTYEITVTNHGPWPATNLVITDTLPAPAAAASLSGQSLGNARVRFEPPLASNDDLSAAATMCLPINNIFRCNVDVLQPGGKMLLNLEYTPAADGLLVNQVEARAKEPDLGLYPNSAIVGTAVGAVNVDLVLDKRALASAVQVGRPITYSLSLTNTGSDSAFGVTVVDTLPPHFEVTGAQSSLGSCESGDGAVTCGIGTMLPNAPVAITISAVPSVTYNAPVVVVNSATAMLAVGVDSAPANNTDTASVVVNPVRANLAITKTASAATIMAGDRLVYTLTAANLLSSTVAGARLVDALPAGLRLASMQPSQGSCQVSQANVVTCQLGDLTPAGAEVTLAVTATQAGVMTNSAVITSPFALEVEPGNNTSSAVATTVTARQVDLSLSKVAAASVITVGRGLVYTLTVANAPTANPATAVILTDTLPAAVAFGQASTAAGSCAVAGQTVTCALGQLAPGAARQVFLLVTPTVVATFSNVAVVADAFGQETSPLDNTAAVTVTSLGLSGIAAPGVAVTLVFTNPAGQVITVLVPAGAVNQSIRLQLDPINLPAAPPGGFGFAGIGFRLTAYSYPGNALQPGFAFSQPISITVHYRDADLANITDENTLVLYYLSAGNWVDAAATCGAGSQPWRNPAANLLSVAVCHLTEFALLGELQTTPTYLPVILKGNP